MMALAVCFFLMCIYYVILCLVLGMLLVNYLRQVFLF